MPENLAKNTLDIDLSGPEAVSDPYQMYDQLRSQDPVHWSESDNYWFITRYNDLTALIRDERMSSDRFRAVAANLPEEAKERLSALIGAVSSWMLMSDPPSHTRMRGLVNKAFTPRMIEMIRSRIQTLVDGMLDSVLKNGRLDVIADLADPLPAIVIADLLGVPTEDHSQFKKWSDDIAAGITGTGSVGTQSERFLIAQKSFIELSDYFRGIVEELRGHPEDNLLSALVEAEEAGDKLTEEELFANCVLLMFAGNETTTNLIGNGTLALLRNPVQMQMLQNDGELIGSAIEELLRFDSPVQKLGRLATADIEIGGKVIKSGELVWLCYGAANRDPEQFSKPDQLDITRSDNRHVAFAQGIHYCLGASLARLEGQIAIGTLLKRIPEIKLTSDDLEWNPSTVLRGLKALPVAF